MNLGLRTEAPVDEYSPLNTRHNAQDWQQQRLKEKHPRSRIGKTVGVSKFEGISAPPDTTIQMETWTARITSARRS
jgi:hypothetical protein